MNKQSYRQLIVILVTLAAVVMILVNRELIIIGSLMLIWALTRLHDDASTND